MLPSCASITSWVTLDFATLNWPHLEGRGGHFPRRFFLVKVPGVGVPRRLQVHGLSAGSRSDIAADLTMLAYHTCASGSTHASQGAILACNKRKTFILQDTNPEQPFTQSIPRNPSNVESRAFQSVSTTPHTRHITQFVDDYAPQRTVVVITAVQAKSPVQPRGVSTRRPKRL